MPQITINMSSAHRKMIFTTIMLVPYFLIECLAEPTASPALQQRATASSSNSRSYSNNNFRLRGSNENYDTKKDDQDIFEESSGRDSRDSGRWQLSPRKQYRYYSSRYEPIATAASSQYTNIYRNRNLFSKPNWISGKGDNVESVENPSDGIVYFSAGGRVYDTRGTYPTRMALTNTDQYMKTTAEPRTAPATEVSSVTERPTTTHEMHAEISEFESVYQDSRRKKDNDRNDRKLNPRFGARYTERSTDHYSAEATERQDKRTHFPSDEDDAIVFPTTPIFGKDYIRPTVDYDPNNPTVKPLDPNDFAELRNLIEARKKTDVENRNSQLLLHSNSKLKPPICKDPNGYCTDSPDYPKDILNSILENSVKPEVFQQIFGDSLDNSTSNEAQELSGRIDLPQEIPLCASVEHTIYPKVAQNKEGKYMYVVNHDEYIQGVKVEKCLGENGGCQFSDGSPTGYQTSCKQKYIYKKLLAFNEGKAMTDTFRLPSCCVCYIKSSFVSDRINADTSPINLSSSKKVNTKSQVRSTSAPTGTSTTANLLITSNDDAVATELPDSEAILAGRTDDKVVENSNSTAKFSHDNVNSDNSSSTTASSPTKSLVLLGLEQNVAKSGSARSF